MPPLYQVVVVSMAGTATHSFGPVEAKDAEDAAGQAVEAFGGDRSKVKEEPPTAGLSVYSYGTTHQLAVERLSPNP